jgi:hypothetical protein
MNRVADRYDDQIDMFTIGKQAKMKKSPGNKSTGKNFSKKDYLTLDKSG